MGFDYAGVDLKLVVLKLLSKSPMHGYKLATEVETIFGKKPSNGALNPLFNKLEDDGLIESFETVEQGRYKKIYRLSKKGQTILGDSIDNAKKFFDY